MAWSAGSTSRTAAANRWRTMSGAVYPGRLAHRPVALFYRDRQVVTRRATDTRGTGAGCPTIPQLAEVQRARKPLPGQMSRHPAAVEPSPGSRPPPQRHWALLGVTVTSAEGANATVITGGDRPPQAQRPQARPRAHHTNRGRPALIEVAGVPTGVPHTTTVRRRRGPTTTQLRHTLPISRPGRRHNSADSAAGTGRTSEAGRRSPYGAPVSDTDQIAPLVQPPDRCRRRRQAGRRGAYHCAAATPQSLR